MSPVIEITWTVVQNKEVKKEKKKKDVILVQDNLRWLKRVRHEDATYVHIQY